MKKLFIKYKNIFIVSSLFVLLLVPTIANAQSNPLTENEVVKARVLEAQSQPDEEIPGTNVINKHQTIEAEILEGEKKGDVIEFDNANIQLKEGKIFYLNISADEDGSPHFSVEDPYRMNVIYFFLGLFILLVIWIGGIQGIRGLASLAGSLVLIIFVLLPGILHGFSPILASIGVASLIIILGSYVTHGFNKTTSSAVIGMIVTVVFTGIMAYVATHMASLTGYGSEEAVFLNSSLGQNIDVGGLLLGGIIIGLLGVLYDVAIGQAISVEELHRIAPHVKSKEVFKRAMRIGREHIGALVNTLAIAYVGASLPLLLLFSIPPVHPALMLNKEIFSEEIIRALIGSIGLVLAVPITTFLSVKMLIKRNDANKATAEGANIKDEEKKLEEYAHHH